MTEADLGPARTARVRLQWPDAEFPDWETTPANALVTIECVGARLTP